MAHKKTAPKHFQRLLQVAMMLMIIFSVGFYGMQLLTSHAATASYTCNSGDSLSGSTCTHKSTYSATSSTSYSCPRGGTLNGSTCTYTAHSTTSSYYYCDSPAPSGGSTCSYSAPKTCGSGGTQISGNSCQAPVSCGYTFSGYKCQCYVGTQQGNYCYYPTYYYCPYGGSLSGSTCSYPAHTGTSTSYYCDGTDTRSGTTCSYTATNSTLYSCNNGDSLSGTTCTHVVTYAATYHSATVTTGTTKTPATSVTITPLAPPSAPADFKAAVHSSKVVELNWTAGQAAAGVKDYELDRSTDNVSWGTIATISDTSYSDTTTDFATKYYYRVRETDNSGANSDYATTNVTTGKFSSTGSTISSDDKVVTISIPSGAFDRDVSCSVTSSQGGLPTVPTKLLLVGPYDILCVADDGSIISTFKKPLTVTMDLSGVSGGYGAVTAKTFDSSSENDPKSTYDAKAHKISFELTAEKSFAIYGKKQGGAATKIFFVLLLLVVGGVGAVHLRRYWAGRQAATPGGALPAEPLAMIPAATVASVPMPAPAPNAENLFEQAVNKPNCTHLSMAHQVQPQSTGCAECTAEHKHWKGLRICLTCGHVGCSDDSDEQHALKHYQQTGHPLRYEYGNPKGDSIGWCYIDQTYI